LPALLKMICNKEHQIIAACMVTPQGMRAMMEDLKLIPAAMYKSHGGCLSYRIRFVVSGAPYSSPTNKAVILSEAPRGSIA
jgi:hypothetical protein